MDKYIKKMETNITLKKKIKIESPISEVWKALTDLLKLEQAMFGCNVITNWEVGSKILFKGSWEGNEFIDKGTIIDFEEGKSYTYDYWSNFSGLPDSPENYSIIKFQLDEVDNGTILYLVQSNFATQSMYQHSEKNWDIALNSMKELVENK